MRSQSFYKGGFLNGRFCGEGFYQGVLGERYQGQWFNNQMNGFGSYSWTGGVQFRGSFARGKCSEEFCFSRTERRSKSPTKFNKGFPIESDEFLIH